MTHAVARLVAGAAAATLLAACGAPDAGPVLAPFRAELDRLAREAETAQHIAVGGVDDWLFLAPELRLMSLDGLRETDAGDAATAETGPVATILDLSRQLEALGVELLLAPVPPKSVVFPEKVSGAVAVPIRCRVSTPPSNDSTIGSARAASTSWT